MGWVDGFDREMVLALISGWTAIETDGGSQADYRYVHDKVRHC